MNKKSQITIFIILGFLIVASAFLAWFIINEEQTGNIETMAEKALTVPAEFEPVKHYIEACIEETVKDALLLIGYQGGVIYSPPEQPRLYHNIFEMAIWYYNGKDTSLSDGDVAAQIDTYINENLESCLNFYYDFDEDIETGEVDAKTRLTKSAVVVDLIFPVKVNKGDTIIENNRLLKTVDTDFKQMLDVGREVIEKELDSPNEIDLSYLIDSDYEVALYEYSEDMMIITLTHKTESIDDLPLVLNFANKFNFSLNENNDPIIMDLSNLEVQVGELVEFFIIAYDQDGDPLNYTLSNPFIDINPTTGFISFTASEYMMGNQTVLVSVEDSKGGADFSSFTMNIHLGDYTPIQNRPPVLDIPAEFTLTGGETFILQVNATDPDGDYLSFSDTLPIFDISIDGLIAYIPLMYGSWTGEITVSDGELSDTETVTFDIIN